MTGRLHFGGYRREKMPEGARKIYHAGTFLIIFCNVENAGNMKLSPLIDVTELRNIYQNRDVVVVDASNGENARQNYDNEHVEGAVFVDVNQDLATIQSDLSQGGRHPLPEVPDFIKTMSALGISENHHVIIYDDQQGANAAARLWWMLKSLGQNRVQVVNGGLREMKRQGFPLTNDVTSLHPLKNGYLTSQWQWPIIDMKTVEKVSQLPEYIVVDVRSRNRYEGKEEPIDLVAGHIPGAINIPFTENLDENGLFLSPDMLQKKYKAAVQDKDSSHQIVYCGSGVTACFTLLAMYYAGMDIPVLYPGSWSEWSRNDKKIETLV